jgi:hypothetical protein
MGTAAAITGAAGPEPLGDYRDGQDGATGGLRQTQLIPQQAECTTTRTHWSGSTRQPGGRDSEADYMLQFLPVGHWLGMVSRIYLR